MNPHRNTIFLISFVTLAISHYPIERFFKKAFDLVIPFEKFPKGSAARESKLQMLGERAFRFIHYTGRTPVLYWILLSSDFLDRRLGGNYDKPFYYRNYPCQAVPEYLDSFYIFKIAFHLYELGNTLVFGRGRADFLEYFLHHLMTWALIHFSYTLNMIPVGAAIMLLHDLTDIPVTTIKLITDITNKYLEFSIFFVMLGSWCYFRLWFFPFKVIARMIEECYHETVPGMNYSVMNMIIFFLCSLVCLHVFWAHLMVRSALRKTKASKHEVILKDTANRMQ